MFKYQITFDDNFNMKEYDVDQPGLVISIKLTRWHTQVKSVLTVLFRKWSGPLPDW